MGGVDENGDAFADNGEVGSLGKLWVIDGDPTYLVGTKGFFAGGVEGKHSTRLLESTFHDGASC